MERFKSLTQECIALEIEVTTGSGEGFGVQHPEPDWDHFKKATTKEFTPLSAACIQDEIEVTAGIGEGLGVNFEDPNWNHFRKNTREENAAVTNSVLMTVFESPSAQDVFLPVASPHTNESAGTPTLKGT